MTEHRPDREMACWEPNDPRPRSHEDIGGVVALAWGVPLCLALWLGIWWAVPRLWTWLVGVVS